MSPEKTYRERYRNTMTEKALDETFQAYAIAGGWLTFHTHDSRRSEPGWPDRVAVRGGQILFAELKSASGRLRPEQKVVLAALTKLAEYAPGVIFVRVWRPEDLDEMRMFLRPRGSTASWRPAAGSLADPKAE